MGSQLFSSNPFYCSIAEVQWRKTERGAALASSSFVAIRNRFPSPLTAYENRSKEDTGRLKCHKRKENCGGIIAGAFSQRGERASVADSEPRVDEAALLDLGHR